MNDLTKKREQLLRAYMAASSEDPLLFVEGLTIPSARGPKLFRSCIQDFQRITFRSLAPSLIALREGVMPPERRFWIERTKKASKDADLAACALWSVAFAKRPFYAQVAAADKDQAGIVKRRISDLLYYNPWLQELVAVQRSSVKQVLGPASLDVLAADTTGSHGETPDLLIVNELSHVSKWEFIQNLLDNADGVAQGLVVVATNAGFRGSQAELLRDVAEKNDWRFHVWSEPAPWILPASLADARRRNSPNRFRRLWQGQWVSGRGDALSEADVAQIFRRKLEPLEKPEQDWTYIAGLDLGVSHDHSGMVVVGVHETGRRIRLARMRAWEPPNRNGEIDLQSVENGCREAHRTFNISWFGYDPSQAKLMAQRLSAEGVPMREVSFASGKNLTAMAESLMQVVKDGVLECFDDADGRLRRDFGKFNIVERTYGYRLEATSDEYGHADVGTALVICLPRALELLEGSRGWTADHVISEEDDSKLTDEEIKLMPKELKEICQQEDDDKRSSLEDWNWEDF